jgi:sodium-dependent phosphate cotransporter
VNISSSLGGLDRLHPVIKVMLLLVALYAFLFSIKLLGHSFKLFGTGFAEQLISTTSNPFIGLFIGISATAIIQSSSTTTSIAVSLVAAGALSLRSAIPLVMGANIGTTVTNILVSLGYVGNRIEFRRAFAGATVHDFFNLLAVIVLFPLEIRTHCIEKSATVLSNIFCGMGGLTLFNPLTAITAPLISLFDKLLADNPGGKITMAIISLAILFFALICMVKLMRSIMLRKMETLLDRYLFGNTVTSLSLGILLTAIVQSSSVTTSLVVPLVGAGILSVRQIFPFTLGANIGTTVTAILAALATSNSVAVTVAFGHLVFNIMGIAVFLPLKKLPIFCAESVAKFVTTNKRNALLVAIGYFCIFLLPLIIAIAK